MNLLKLYSFRLSFWESIKSGVPLKKSLIYQVLLVLCVSALYALIDTLINSSIIFFIDIFLELFILYICYSVVLIISVVVTFYINRSAGKITALYKGSNTNITLKELIQILIYSSSFFFIMQVFDPIYNFIYYRDFGIIIHSFLILLGYLPHILFIASFYRGVRSVFSSDKRNAIVLSIILFILYNSFISLFEFFFAPFIIY